jgi:glycosyltransferase involved in cell wall biosynthesis
MNNEVIVSVCMITYNQENYIKQSLESALFQKTTFKYEIIIGEDNSTDNTRNILLDYKAKYPDKIKLILNATNIGAVENLAQVIKECNGKYIAILEGDDYWICDYKIQKQADFLNKNLNFSTCFHATRLIDSKGALKRILPIEKFRRSSSNLLDLIENDVFMATCSTMFRARLYEYFPNVFYVLRNGCDWALSVLNAEHGDIGYIDEILSVYRTGSSEFAWTSNSLSHIYTDAIKINQEFNKYFNYKYDAIIKKKISNYKYIIAIDNSRNGELFKGIRLLIDIKNELTKVQLIKGLFIEMPFVYMKGIFKFFLIKLKILN